MSFLDPDLIDQASPEVQVVVDRFIEAALDEAMDMIRYGTPEVKAGMFKSIMPLLQRRLEGESESERMAKLRTAQDALMDELRSNLIPAMGQARPAIPTAVVPEDTQVGAVATQPSPDPYRKPAKTVAKKSTRKKAAPRGD